MELIGSIKECLKQRFASPLYGTFVLSLILWNWKFFFVLFFQEQAALSVPKIEYVQNFLNNPVLEHVLYFLILPFMSTFIIIWFFPILANLAHAKSLSFNTKKKILFDREELIYQKEKEKVLKELKNITQKQVESRREIEKNVFEKDKWELEFNSFESTPQASIYFRTLIKAVYEGRGFLNQTIPASALANFHALGLIRFLNDMKTQVEFTEKGMFFVQKYLKNSTF